jgi:hypothetical protein
MEVYLMDRCKLCNRPLKTPESKSIGIGPACLKVLIGYIPQIKREILNGKVGKVQDKETPIDGQINMFSKEVE